MPTFPGFNANFELQKYPASVRESLRRLADSFYVTRSFDVITIGNSSYYAALMRPTDETSVYLNTEREIVTIFSTYDTFEVRTLEAFDEVYSLVESSRVDESLRFLISDDSTIQQHIALYLQSNPEYPIIVPLHADVLKYSGGRPLIEAIRSNYVIRDLFGYQAPLRQEHFFFGRKGVVNSVLDLAKSAQNSSLFGLRKSGKTSTIFAIQRKSKALGIATVVVDCQDPAVHARRFDELLWYVLSRVRQVVGGKKIRASDYVGMSPAAVSEQFRELMSSSLVNNQGQVLIIFDEIENISPGTAASEHWRSGQDSVLFWQTLRAIYQSGIGAKLSFCLVGTSPKLLETATINGVDNPVYLFAQKRFIPNLTIDETEEMIRRLGFFMGLDFPTETIAALQGTYGGHPFFTRQLCSKVHQSSPQSRPVTISERQLKVAEDAFLGEMESYLVEILRGLKRLYPDEFEVLSAAIKGSDEELQEYGREAPDLLDHLMGYGLIKRVGSDLVLAFKSLRPALERGFPELFFDNESNWREIVDRRNQIETNIRRILYFDVKSWSPDKWSSLLQKQLTKRRFESLNSLDPGHLFSSKSSPLYLTDLIAILRDEKILAQLGTSRSTVTRDLDTVNKLRRDAHALEVSDSEMQEFRLACDRLDATFFVP